MQWEGMFELDGYDVGNIVVNAVVEGDKKKVIKKEGLLTFGIVSKKVESNALRNLFSLIGCLTIKGRS